MATINFLGLGFPSAPFSGEQAENAQTALPNASDRNARSEIVMGAAYTDSRFLPSSVRNHEQDTP
ncbi:MAG: hypothetical protein ACAI34_03965 [Verrucomicrobium sp.]